MFRARFPLALSFALAAVLAFAPNPARAQYSPSGKHPLVRYGYDPGYYAPTTFRLPPGSRGFQATRMIEQNFRVTERSAALLAAKPVTPERPAATEPAASDLAVAINPPPSKPMTVSIRGPDGVVRTFPLASPEAIQPRTIIVRPGEKLTIGINGAITVKLQRK
jgi:hypothetical protein